jgi:ABC-type lipoprotein release transport system permease subunit
MSLWSSVADSYSMLLIGILLFLTSFVLTLLSAQKIKDSSWLYGVLRAVGLTKRQGNDLFLIETMCIVTAATVLGLAQGLLIAFA